MRFTILASAVLALSSCSVPTVDATGRYINFAVDGDIGIQDTSGPMTTVTADNSIEALGLDEDEGTPSIAADFKWGMPHLTFNSQSTQWSGSGIVQSDISSGGFELEANTAVDSELDLGITNAILTWDFAPTDLEIGLGIGVTLLDVLAQFSGIDPINGPTTIDLDESLPVPLLAARLGFDLGPIEFHSYIAGISAEIEDDEASYFDFDAHARWAFLGGAERLSGAVVVGWRQIDVEIEVTEDDESADGELSFSGPYVGFQLSL